MRKVAAIAAALSALVFGVSAAAGATGQTVLGGGKTATDIFSINAHSDVPLTGGIATGHLDAKENPIIRSVFTFDFAGDVTCMRAIANTAVVGGTVTKSLQNGVPFFPNLHGFLFYVNDNGNQQVLPDSISYEFLIPVSPGPLCPPPNPVLASVFPLMQGNVIVNS